MDQLNLFRTELETLGVSCILDNDNLFLEYSFDKVDQKAVNKLFNQYVGFVKSIGIKTDHSQVTNTARYIIPLSFIVGEDLTDEQVSDAAEFIQQRLSNVSMSQINDLKHAVGYRADRVKDGKFHAFRNFFAANKEQAEWEELVIRGLATKRKQFSETVYHVSTEGFQLLSSVLDVQVLPEK